MEVKQGARQVERILQRHLRKNASRITLIAGLFNESLTPKIVEEHRMQPAAYVDVDCDLFMSTEAALKWMLENALLVPGTLLGYDDWWTLPCVAHHHNKRAVSIRHDASTHGEWRAHVEAARRYLVELECVAGPCRLPPDGFARCGLFNSIAPVFLVRSVGKRMQSGVDLSRSEVVTFLTTWPVCRAFGRAHHVVGRWGDTVLSKPPQRPRSMQQADQLNFFV